MSHPLSAALAAADRSASWLSKKAGYDASYAHKVMAGTREPSPEFRRKAAELLGVAEATLFPETDQQPVEAA